MAPGRYDARVMALARGLLLLAGAVACVLVTLTEGMATTGYGGAFYPTEAKISFAVGIALAVFGIWQLLVGVGRLVRRG